MKEVSLVVMAAGMGSRFGGLKQLEPIGKNGEVIIDYSVYDAIKAGFNKVVFIIKKEIEEDFKRIAGDRISEKIKTEYVFQETPPHRKKPYGTAQAILCCKDVVNGPFAVINADDYYDRTAFVEMYKHLSTSSDYSMVGYYLHNTLTENGTVARGVCDVKDGYLADVTEHTSIAAENDFTKDTIVSMNLWGLQPDIFAELEAQFETFKQTADISKDEFFIPTVIDNMIKKGQIKVKVINSPDKWYGVTYKEDKAAVCAAIEKMTEEGKYNGI